MWIFTSRGFFSIVADKNNADNLLVRARVAGDIEAFWPKAKVEKTPAADYMYRVSLPRKIVADALAGDIIGIRYGNFKNSIKDKDRAFYYESVWNIMATLQADMEMEG